MSRTRKTFWMHCRRDGAVFAYSEKPPRTRMRAREDSDRVQLSFRREQVNREMGTNLALGELAEFRCVRVAASAARRAAGDE